MPRGNPSPKLAITVDPDVHEKVILAAAEDGVSVSAWMTTAARRALLVRDGLAAVAEWEAEQGALTESELVAARERVAANSARALPAVRRERRLRRGSTGRGRPIRSRGVGRPSGPVGTRSLASDHCAGCRAGEPQRPPGATSTLP